MFTPNTINYHVDLFNQAAGLSEVKSAEKVIKSTTERYFLTLTNNVIVEVSLAEKEFTEDDQEFGYTAWAGKTTQDTDQWIEQDFRPLPELPAVVKKLSELNTNN